MDQPIESNDAIEAAKNHAEAIERARSAQVSIAVREGLNEFFDRGVESGKYIDIGRIPFICDDIHKIHLTQQSILDNLSLVTKMVYGFAGVVLLGTLGVIGTVILKVLTS